MGSREDQQDTQVAIPPELNEKPLGFGFEEVVTVSIERQRFLPSVELAEEIERAVKAANGFMDVPQASPAETSGEDRLEPLRAVIGDRVEKIIANMGFRASARELQSYRIAEEGRFCDEMRVDLERAFTLGAAADEVLCRLEAEVQAFANVHNFEGAWGRLVADDLGLTIVTKELARATERPQATVVGGRAFRSLIPR